jgi:broad specificity phosphatase PhoE
MSRLYLVRHGQASFFSDNYDLLSPVGEEQARELARFWLERRIHPTEVHHGTLQRQMRTAEVVGEVFQAAGVDWPEPNVVPGLNEYPADEMMNVLLPHLTSYNERIDTLNDAFQRAEEPRERYVTFHRLLEAIMDEWINGGHELDGLPPWHAFSSAVRAATREILAASGSGREVAVFTSGGVIGVCVQTSLQAPDIKAAELNWRIHNGSVTTFTFSNGGARVALDHFNDIQHFTRDDLRTFR